MRQYGLFGPPALLFMNQSGEISSHRVIGFQDAASFVQHLRELADRLATGSTVGTTRAAPI